MVKAEFDFELIQKAKGFNPQFRAEGKSMAGHFCEGKDCHAILTLSNGRNVFCWNCLYKIAVRNGSHYQANFIAENYL